MAQVMGHKRSATAEGYCPRSLDALRPFLAKNEERRRKQRGIGASDTKKEAPQGAGNVPALIEAHILEQAGIVFDAKTAPGALRVVVGI